MTRQRIAVLSGGRAEFGLLLPICQAILATPALEIQLILTGEHCEPDAASRVEVDASGLRPAAEVPMGLSNDRGPDLAAAIGRATVGLAAALERLAPDLLLILGDRYELLAAAAAATVMGLPIAHVAGGDVTAGAYDDGIRHALTKLSHLHFPNNAGAARRIAQLGEAPERIHCVGSTALDRLLAMERPDRSEAASRLGLAADRPWIVATMHPVTRDRIPSLTQLEALLDALADQAQAGIQILFTAPNRDNEGSAMRARILEWCQTTPGAIFCPSLGFESYAMAVSHATLVIGNSSSGIMEAPALGVPSVNVGRRQDGRPRARSVIDCAPTSAAIAEAIDRALALEGGGTESLFGDGQASVRIVKVLANLPPRDWLLQKPFVDLEAALAA
ncbi:UDP-N-acetylglucosamine 2-epimerase [Thermaurantiacus sp.]